MSEIVALPNCFPVLGTRELVNWDRPDGKTYYNVPIVWLREVTEADYIAQHPNVPAGHVVGCRFYEVSVD
jgi:hypothetical protein